MKWSGTVPRSVAHERVPYIGNNLSFNSKFP